MEEKDKRFLESFESFFSFQSFCSCGSIILDHTPYCTACGAENTLLNAERCFKIWEKTPEALAAACSAISHQNRVREAQEEHQSYVRILIDPYCEWCGVAMIPQPCKIALSFVTGDATLEEFSRIHIPICQKCSFEMEEWKMKQEGVLGRAITWEEFFSCVNEWGRAFSSSIDDILNKIPSGMNPEDERKIIDSFRGNLTTYLLAKDKDLEAKTRES
ncbi:MAG: hypothetical protein A3J54_03505 [Candidatus Ryanbacteria bacterium RIFCSPHIGHO2_02_FULL_45_13b]|uniref:Uncharacterized protein n=1 Tax=Candidatus Ryanbacteria bacterium RIFCSPHIGHO2_02_FULL_45_13b TaxID=1802117 RepID=A0A1G2G4I2_9BACT|nr:MAG: hypothetical protein A3J54_03505 [Candidatus Ryanbacteria bacterium RIFCSPHIGHO2_02_FULL_45_13b]